MPARIGSRRVPYAGKLYLLKDRFGSTVPAGLVDGTRSTGGQLRTVVDTAGTKISIASGVLTFATGATINDAVRWPSLARLAGRTFYAKIVPSETITGIPKLGWDDNTSGAINDALLFGASGVLQIVANGGTAFNVGAYTAVAYRVCAQMRSTGLFWYIKGGAFLAWTLICVTTVGTAVGLPTIGVGSTTSVFTADDALGFAAPLAAPLASDSFARGNGVLGSTDGLAIPEPGGAGLAWQFDAGCWTIATNKAVGTPTAGNELSPDIGMNDDTQWVPGTGWSVAAGVATHTLDTGSYLTAGTGNFSGAGVWYLLTADVTFTAGGVDLGAGSVGGPTFTAAPVQTVVCAITTGRQRAWGQSTYAGTLDNFSWKALTLSSLFATVPCGTSNVKVRATVAALTTGTQAGVVGRLDSAASPANFVIAYFDGAGNVKIGERVAGVYAALATAAKAFTAADELELDLNETAWRLYHVTAAGVATLIGSGTTNVTTGNSHGLFSTYASNTFSACTVWAKGAGGEYAVLDTLGA